jgi:hypothetical protein
MPLISGGLVVVAPEAEVITGPTVAYFETVGIPNFSWIDPDGVEWPLSNISESQGWFTLNGPAGWGAAPIDFATDSLPRGGESVRYIQSKPSTIQWPLEIFGNTHEQFVRRYRRISRAFTLTTRRGKPGRLRVQRPDGTTREIEAFYADGLGGEGEQNHLYARPVISLFCPEGKWRATTPVVALRTFTATTGGSTNGGSTDPGTPGNPGTGAAVTFFSPFLSVTSSKVVGSSAPPAPVDDTGGDGGGDTGGGGDSSVDPGSQTVIANPGDVEAWPTWTITGPMTQMRAWNLTLGTRFALTYNLAAEQTITITTDRPSVRGPGNTNLSKYIDWFNTDGTELWPLADGNNTLGLEIDGAGPTTAVQMAFTPRYDNS